MGEVIVIGGANVDIKGRSHEGFIPGTSNPGDVVTNAGGVARNIAHNLALLEVNTSLIAFISDDPNGAMVRRETASSGVDISMLEFCPEPTGVYLAIIDDRGELVSAINDMRAAEAMTEQHLMRHEARLVAADLIVADCNINLNCLAWLFDFTRRRQVKLLIEPVSVPKSRKLLELPSTAGAFAITPNLSQLRAITGIDDEAAAINQLHRMNFANVVVHRGRAGVFASDGHTCQPVPASAGYAVSDVTGAGDAAVAGLILGLVSGFNLEKSARLGQHAAALKIQLRTSVATGLNRVNLLALLG